MYGAHRTSATPSDSQATRKRTAATSTSVTSSRSNTRRGRSLRTWASSSPRFPDSRRPMSRSVAVWPSDAVSILRVTGGGLSKRRALTKCFGGGELTSVRMPTRRQLPIARRRRRFEGVLGLARLARSKRERVDVKGFDLGLERLAGNTELRRRPRPARDPPAGLRERGDDQGSLAFSERRHLAPAADRCVARLSLEPRLIDGKRLALAQDHGALDDVL